MDQWHCGWILERSDISKTESHAALMALNVTTIDTIRPNKGNSRISNFFCMKHLLIVLIVFSSLALVAQNQSGKQLRYVSKRLPRVKFLTGIIQRPGTMQMQEMLKFTMKFTVKANRSFFYTVVSSELPSKWLS